MINFVDKVVVVTLAVLAVAAMIATTFLVATNHPDNYGAPVGVFAIAVVGAAFYAMFRSV